MTAKTSALKGVVVPNSSIIVTESTSWAYVETKPGEYARKPVNLTTPVGAGYLVKEGFEPGMKVVVAGASSLLAREADPSAGGDDDDDGPAHPAPKPKARSKDTAAPVAPKMMTTTARPLRRRHRPRRCAIRNHDRLCARRA